MKAIFLLSLVMSIVSLVVSPRLMAAGAEDRAKAAELVKQGNWKEAYSLSADLLGSLSDAQSPEDFKRAVLCTQRLRKFEWLDSLLKVVDEKHLENPGVLIAVSEQLLAVTHAGTVVDGQFRRG